MNHQYGRTLQDTITTLAPAEVLAEAKHFFSTRLSIYAAYPEQEGPTFVSMRGQGGEEVVVGVTPDPRGTRVTGSSYLFDAQVARFLSILPAAPEAAPVEELPVVPDALTAAAARVGGAPG